MIWEKSVSLKSAARTKHSCAPAIPDNSKREGLSVLSPEIISAAPPEFLYFSRRPS